MSEEGGGEKETYPPYPIISAGPTPNETRPAVGAQQPFLEARRKARQQKTGLME